MNIFTLLESLLLGAAWQSVEDKKKEEKKRREIEGMIEREVERRHREAQMRAVEESIRLQQQKEAAFAAAVEQLEALAKQLAELGADNRLPTTSNKVIVRDMTPEEKAEKNNKPTEAPRPPKKSGPKPFNPFAR